MFLNFSDGYYETQGYVSLGCWKFVDLPSMEGVLDGNYKTRSDAVYKCFAESKKRQRVVFAVSDGGSCQALSMSRFTEYTKQGRSTKCAKDGKGGPDASQVYINLST